MKKVLLITGIVGVVGFLTWHFYNQYKLLKKTCINFAGYVIHALSIDRIAIEIKLLVRNKSDIAITLQKYDFKIYINGTYVSSLKSKPAPANMPEATRLALGYAPQTIERGAQSPLNLMVDIDPKNAVSTVFTSGLLLNYNQAVVKIEGEISVNVGGLALESYPVKLEKKLKDMMPDPTAKTATDDDCA